MDYTLIAMIIALLSSGLMAAAAMGYLIHITLTGMRDINRVLKARITAASRKTIVVIIKEVLR